MVHELCRWVVRILKLGIRPSVVDPGFGLALLPINPCNISGEGSA